MYILTYGGHVGVTICSGERESTPKFKLPTSDHFFKKNFKMENKKLYRSRSGSIAGVCTGISNYLNIDPIIMKVIFFASIWSPFPIVLTYVFLWIFLQKEPKI